MAQQIGSPAAFLEDNMQVQFQKPHSGSQPTLQSQGIQRLSSGLPGDQAYMCAQISHRPSTRTHKKVSEFELVVFEISVSVFNFFPFFSYQFILKSHKKSWAWCRIPFIPVLGKQGQADSVTLRSACLPSVLMGAMAVLCAEAFFLPLISPSSGSYILAASSSVLFFWPLKQMGKYEALNIVGA